jgi:predicted nucleotidyltransferase
VSAGPRLRELLQRLVAREIRFVVVGGLAVNAWGYVRGTQDVDLVPDPAADNLDKLAALLVELGGRVEVAEGRLAASAIRTFLATGDRTLVSTDLGPVDVMQGLPQIPGFAQLDRDAVEVDIDGTIVRVCSLESLLAMKRASQRRRDVDDLEALEAAHLPDADSTPGQ